jgi:hypothetical protein
MWLDSLYVKHTTLPGVAVCLKTQLITPPQSSCLDGTQKYVITRDVLVNCLQLCFSFRIKVAHARCMPSWDVRCLSPRRGSLAIATALPSAWHAAAPSSTVPAVALDRVPQQATAKLHLIDMTASCWLAACKSAAFPSRAFTSTRAHSLARQTRLTAGPVRCPTQAA